MIIKLWSLILVLMMMQWGLFSLIQTTPITWQQPSPEIVDIYSRPYIPSSAILAKQEKVLFVEIAQHIPWEWLALAKVQYGEMNIYQDSRAAPQNWYVQKFNLGNYVQLLQEEINQANYHQYFTPLDLPENSFYSGRTSSFSEHAFLVIEYQTSQMVLWYVDVNTQETKILLDGGFTQALGGVLSWFPDNRRILVSLIPENLELPSEPPLVPSGPAVQETSRAVSQSRTYPNVLKNVYEETLFAYYATSQLAIINTATGEQQLIHQPGIFSSVSISPNGKYLLIAEHQRPFSRVHHYASFPIIWYIYDIDKGEVLELARHGLRESRSNWVQTGKRHFFWHEFTDASLLYIIALDEGNPRNIVPFRDELRLLTYPFSGSGESFYLIENRFRDLKLINTSSFLYEDLNFQDNVLSLNLVNTNGKKHQIAKLPMRTVYDHPGQPMMSLGEDGTYSVLLKNDTIFLSGDGVTANHRRPFIDQVNINTFATDRIVEFSSEDYIDIIGFLGDDPEKILYTKQNRSKPPNRFLFDLPSQEEKQLTYFTSNIPEIEQLQRQQIRYPRQDGVMLSGTLFLPTHYDGSTRLPLLMSAYPREFTNAETAGQAQPMNQTYYRPFGPSLVYLALANIAVLVDASFPIVGDPEIVNQSFLEQTIMNAEAAIHYLTQEGIINPDQVVIQGHSYGAFLVVNLLAHSNLFAGGIAQNGAYNRTLTPFGFQAERRTIWQAKDTYLNLSPFLYVDQIQQPLLLIHSENDTNSGTFPMQSRRLFEAMERLGKTCRFVQLPLEEHWYRAKETNLHLLWEYQKFFNEHILNRKIN